MLKAFSFIGVFIITGLWWNTKLNTKPTGDSAVDHPPLVTTDTLYSRAMANYTNYCDSYRGKKWMLLLTVSGNMVAGGEVNIVRKGKNYGWLVISYSIDYIGIPITNKTKQEGMEQPELYWIPLI